MSLSNAERSKSATKKLSSLPGSLHNVVSQRQQPGNLHNIMEAAISFIRVNRRTVSGGFRKLRLKSDFLLKLSKPAVKMLRSSFFHIMHI